MVKKALEDFLNMDVKAFGFITFALRIINKQLQFTNL